MSGFREMPRWLAALFITLVAAGAGWLISQAAFFQTLDLKTVDYRFRLLADRPTASQDIVIAEIDDFSIKLLEPEVGRWPWPRSVHAVFLDFMRQAGARLVVFDVLFVENDEQNGEADQAFVKATAEYRKAVHAAFLGEQFTYPPDPSLLQKISIPGCGRFPTFVDLELPIHDLAVQSCGIGHIAMTLDSDGPWRRSLPLACFQGRLVPSLPVATALVLERLTPSDIRYSTNEVTIGSIRAPLDGNGRLPIWFNGPPGSYSRHSYGRVFYSALQIEEGQKPILDPAVFRDKVVIVGVTAAGLHDLFTTPYSGGAGGKQQAGQRRTIGKMAGAEVHANVLDSLLHRRFLRSAPRWLAASALLLAAALAVFGIFFMPLWVGILVAAVIPLGYLAAAQFAFAARYQVPVVSVMLGWGVAVVLGFQYQYWIEGAEKRRIKKIFSHYVSRDVFSELLSNPAAAALGGKRATATVLFSDLRGFTTLSERTEPEALISQLNEYFSAMVEVIFAHRGTVDKFVGDMIMALFNVPVPDDRHADNSVSCAIAMQRRLLELNARWKEEQRCEFRSGVGINTGEMIVGNVGAESIRNYTVIGDHVNLGSRLESLCKEHQVEIVISEYTRALLTGQYPIREIGEVTVKGKSQPVRTFAVEWRN